MRFSRQPARRRAAPLTCLAGAALLLCGNAARSEADPWYIGASEAITHDTNLFRAPSASDNIQGVAPVVSDTFSTTSLLGGFDQFIGRQHVFGNGTLRYNHFDKNTDLNSTGYGLSTGVDWETLHRLSGTVRVDLNQSLANFNPNQTLQTTQKNLERNAQESATIVYGLADRLSFNAGITHQSVNYSAALFDSQEFHQNVGRLGASYKIGGALTLGGDFRYTKGAYPRFAEDVNGNFFAADYDRHDIDLTAQWDASGASIISGRLSHSSSSYDNAEAQDFSGTTGEVTWTWKPTGRLQLVTDLSRDTGQNSTFLGFVGNAAQANNDQSRLTNQINIAATYEVTGKIVATGTAAYEHRDLGQTIVAINSNATGTDNLRAVGINLRYQPTRTISLGCGVNYQNRNTSQQVAFLSLPYNNTEYTCNGQITLQP